VSQNLKNEHNRKKRKPK